MVLISHDGVEVKNGMRVACSDYCGFLNMGTVTGFKYGLAVVRLDDGYSSVFNSSEIYAR